MSARKTEESANLGQLINRQMALWEVKQKLSRARGEAEHGELAHLKEGPWITLSRQAGSGGSDLARKLAEKLGWQVFDKEIVSAIAHNDPAREKILSSLDEHAIGLLQDFLSNVLVREAVGRNVYAQGVAEIFWTLARKGRAILVGRGGNWLLDPRYGIRVRAVAPGDLRIARLARERKIDRALAEQTMISEDERVSAFIRQMYRQDIDDPLGYDLILNLGHLEIEVAADAVITVLHRKLGTSL